MFAYFQGTRVDWFDVETSRQRKDLAQILLLENGISTISFAVGVHKLTSPFPPCDFTYECSQESCCIVFQLLLYLKKIKNPSKTIFFEKTQKCKKARKTKSIKSNDVGPVQIFQGRPNLAVSYSERRSYKWSDLGFASAHPRYNGCKG